MSVKPVENPSLNDSDPGKYARLDRLAAEFADRYRRGERPALEEYIEQHPDLADEIRELFPAMVEIEGAKGDSHEATPDHPPYHVPPLSRVGDFRIIREVGRGGMGIVYEAEQISLGRHVALKVLPRSLVGDGRSVERFRREARAAARLHHTNIVPVFEVGQDGDVAYYAMQFIQGQGLDLVVQELKRLRDRSRGTSGEVAAPAPVEVDAAPPAVSLRRRRHQLEDRTLLASDDSRRKQLNLIADSILTGFVATRSGASPERPTGEDQPVEAAVKPGGRPSDPAAAVLSASPLSGSAASSASSAVLPGGTQIASVDVPGRRMAFYRSVAQIGRQAAEALAYAHARGTIHRDIKPSNLLLDTAGIVWITDFGLAKGEDEGLTHTGDLIGTIRYMAPERFHGAGDTRADIYGLGLTLYELLVLQPAFHSSDRLRLMEMIKTDEPQRPRAVDSRIPRDLETIVLKAIEKDPRRRYATAAALADDLRRFHEGEPIRARSVTMPERAVKWIKRRPIFATLLASISVLFLALLLGGTWSYVRIKEALADARTQESKAKASERDAVAARAAADRERDKAGAAALDARRQAARSTAQEAQATADSGAIERGLFGLIDALEVAPDRTDEDRAFRLALKRSLDAWQVAHPVLRHLFEGVDRGAFIGNGGTTLALLSGRRLRTIDLVSGQEIGDTAGEEFPTRIIAISPDGGLVITDVGDQTFGIYDRSSRRLRGRFPASPERIFDFGPTQFLDGNRFLIVARQGWNEKIVQCWRLGERFGPVGPIHRVPFSLVPDPHCVLLAERSGHAVLVILPVEHTGSEGTHDRIRFWDLDADCEVEGIHLEPGAEGPGWAFDGKALVTASLEGLVRWWDVASGRPTQPAWWPRRAAGGATLVDGGRLLAVGCDDRRLRWFDLVRKQECAPAAWLPMASIHSVAIAPGGTFFLTQWGRSLGVWQCPGRLRPSPWDEAEHATRSYDYLDAHPDRTAILLGQPSSDGLRMNWPSPISTRSDLMQRSAAAGCQLDVATGRPIGPPLYPWCRYPTYSRDGRLIAAARSTWSRHGINQINLVGVWRAEDGRPVMPLRPTEDFVHSLAFSPDGRTLAVGIVPAVELFDVATGRHLGDLPQSGPITRLEFRPDGRVLAAGTRPGWGAQVGVQLWDVASRRPAGPLFSCQVLPFFRFDPEGRSLLVLDTQTRRLTVLDGETGRPRTASHVLQEHPAAGAAHPGESEQDFTGGWNLLNRTVAVDVRPDGRVLAEASRSAVVRQWDVNSGHPVGPPLGHPVPIMALAYSPDGGTLACGAIDGAVRLWDAATGQMLGPPLRHGGLLLYLAFSRDGRSLIVVTRDGQPYTWPVPRAWSSAGPGLLREWVEASVGFRQREDGTMTALSAAGWASRRNRLEAESPEFAPPRFGAAMLVGWHRERARELERLGQEVAADRHRRALAALCPDDWTTMARRADALASAGQFDAADAEYARAGQSASGAALTDWQWLRALAHVDPGSVRRAPEAEKDLALWYLDKVVAARPDEWRPLIHRSEVLHRMGRHDRREADEDRALSAGAGPFIAFDCAADASAHRLPLRARRLLSAFAEALDREITGSRTSLIEWRSALLVHVGARSDYEHFCRYLVHRDSASGISTLSLAAACAVAPCPRDVTTHALRRLETTIPRVSESSRHHFLSALGCLLYRTGQPAAAIRALEEGARRRGEEWAEDLAFLAMAHQALGHHAQAVEKLARCEALIADPTNRWGFWDMILVEIYRNEAEAKVRFDPAFPAEAFAR